MATIFYARVSDFAQTIEHQETQARAAGFNIDLVLADHGVSGVNTRLAERPEGKRLYDVLRNSDVLVLRWIDRLGRNYSDVCDAIREFMRRGVVIKTIINGMTFDGATKDPIQQAVRDSLIAFMAATAQAQAEATKEAQRAGIDYAKAHGRPDGGKVFRGRKPSYTRDQFNVVCDMLGQEAGPSVISKATGLSRQTVYRIKDDRAGSEAILREWGM